MIGGKTIDLTKVQIPPMASGSGVEAKCYAKSLGNCHGGISREHYISRTILDQIGSISGKGVPWIGDAKKRLGPSALTVSCLCQRHNNYLSPLDQIAGEYFRFVGRFGEDVPERILVPGYLLERWLLKALFGLLSTGKFEHAGKKYTADDLGSSWVKVLFGLEPMPPGCGLYMIHQPGQNIRLGKDISLGPIYLEGSVCGLQADVAGFTFYFTLCEREIAFNKKSPAYSAVMYRPNEINKDPFPKAIRYVWK